MLHNISLGARLTRVYDVIAFLLCLKLAWLQLGGIRYQSVRGIHRGCKQTARLVTLVILSTKGDKSWLHRAIITFQSS